MSELLAGPSELQAFDSGLGHTCWRWLGAWPDPRDPNGLWHFATWAPNAEAVAVVGSWSHWQPTPLQRHGSLWHGTVTGPRPGDLYKLRVTDVHGLTLDRADPYARRAELRPGTASQLDAPSQHVWGDQQWLEQRADRHRTDRPLAIYEVHLGSWKSAADIRSYRDLAAPLIAHVKYLGFTHVELLPLMEHPYDPSWGYQVTGYFAATSRFGTPDDLRYLVDQLHQAGIGVLVDWVPAHFPRDLHALGRFDGTPLYEHPDPQRGEHPDWGTYIFDYGRPEVRSFLLASAHYWLESFHFDGLRVDAVASMLYLDYSRQPGQWTPNRDGGNVNYEAVEFIKTLNAMLRHEFCGALCIAEESTAYARVTGDGPDGLGFQYKWNMGWMHDSLRYLSHDPIHRRWHHDIITFATTYAFAEHFVLPLSHDEVVHGKGSLVRKMGGRWQDGVAQLRLLYGFQWLHPGKKLLFMGQEFAQENEWNQDIGLDWHLCEQPERKALLAWLAALGALYQSRRELQFDCHPKGFEWVEGNDRDHGVLVWQRRDVDTGRALVAVLHFTPVWRPKHGVPMPQAGSYQVILSSADPQFAGDQPLPAGPLATHAHYGRPSVDLDLAPYQVLVLELAGDAAKPLKS
ncbi:MAG: 1,4-alpha-glucan branching protein GlgB [Deltaproteobacteria bacterium]|nr:1,4-alpha-glucan branching protein GlgB [Deltaproteobacteria bacterium]